MGDAEGTQSSAPALQGRDEGFSIVSPEFEGRDEGFSIVSPEFAEFAVSPEFACHPNPPLKSRGFEFSILSPKLLSPKLPVPETSNLCLQCMNQIKIT